MMSDAAHAHQLWSRFSTWTAQAALLLGFFLFYCFETEGMKLKRSLYICTSAEIFWCPIFEIGYAVY